nr:hypothetical protein [Snodgrassella alvi]
MKKLLFAVFGLCIGSSVFAESPQMQYIKKLYKESVKLESREINNNPRYYLKYFDSNIRKIYARDDKYGEATEGIACIDYDVLWQGQDLDPKAKLTFTQPSTDKVKVTIGATEGLEKRSVIYQVKCQKDGNCKITEIFEGGKPFTKEMSKCLDDFYRTEIKKVSK